MKNRIVASIMALAITASAAAVLPTSTASADWVQQSDGWHYYNEDGTPLTDSWLYDSYYNDWYHLNENGIMDTNKWIYDSYSKKWCYVDANGSKLKNTTKTFDNGLMYTFLEDGSMWRWYLDTKTGKSYYIDNDSNRATFEPAFFSNLDIDQNANEDEKVKTTVELGNIKQVRTVGEIEYTLNIDLKKWDLNTSTEQIWHISNLFWNCYPKMYTRFVSDVKSDKCEITIAIENEGYGVAECGAHRVHIHDHWLKNNPNDYDCITHELGHSLQNRLNAYGFWNGWNGYYCEDSDYIENFADYCRYVYAYNGGYYNDEHWDPAREKIKEGDTECVNHNSIKFLIWLDYMYSKPEDNIDVIVNFSDVCRSKVYGNYNWESAWTKIFAGVPGLEGRTIKSVWDEYLASDFSSTTASVPKGRLGGKSPLITKYNVRNKLAR